MPFKSSNLDPVATGVSGVQSGGNSIATGGLQVQHTIHDLEPLAHYTMRVLAVNAIGQSRPSVALSLRTEEEGKFEGKKERVMEFPVKFLTKGKPAKLS